MALNPEQRERIVKMYKEGKKTADITRELGVARSSIYFVLKDEGVTVARQRTHASPIPAMLTSGPSSGGALLDWSLARVAQLEHENGALRERIRIGREALEG